MKKITLILLLLLVPALSFTQDILFDKSDSIRIEKILADTDPKEYATQGERILDIANRFIGEQYIASTLENGKHEPLYISCTKLDCTTFVELVLAIATTSKDGGREFSDVCRNLERIRYRGGTRDGYTSRLHYTSWWIEDNIKKGIVQEIKMPQISKRRRVDLHFMSRNSYKYPMLYDDTVAVSAIEELEKKFRGVYVDYIPKNKLNKNADILDIKDGDIIALITNADGLDIAHIGFAFWKDGKVHLMHASGAKKMVIKDSLTLYEYQKRRKSQPGIRVLRAL